MRSRSALSIAATAAVAIATSGCFSLVKPFDLPEYRSFVRGASTGPHVFFAIASESGAFDLASRQDVLVYDLKARAVHELSGEHGAFVADGDHLYAVVGEDLVRFEPRAKGKLERVETVVTGIGPDVTKVVPAGAAGFVAGFPGEIRLFARGATSGGLGVYEGGYLDYSYDAAADTVWVIRDETTLAGVPLADILIAPKNETGREVPKAIQYQLPMRTVHADPVVAGENHLVVFDRRTALADVAVIDKRTGRIGRLPEVMIADRDFGVCDIAPLGGDRFVVAFSEDDAEQALIYEVDLAAGTWHIPARIDEVVYSVVPDPEGLVIGARGHLYFLDPEYRTVNVRDLTGATTFARGAAQVANATVSGLATAGLGVGAVAAAGLAIGTAPVWLPILLWD